MIYDKESGDITLAFAGDTFINRRMSMHSEPGFLAVADILRGADASLTISESLFHNFEAAPIPDAVGYGTYVQCDPRVIADLKWFGIDAVSTANHHCYGYGEEGVLANIRYLDEYDMPHAGTGPSLTEAAAPTYFETSKGTVALIGVTLSLPNLDHRAGDARGPVRARPGANVVRKRNWNVVPRETFTALAHAARGLGIEGRQPIANDATEMFFAGQRFVVGDAFSREMEINEYDFDLNLRWVRDARRMADWVVVAAYCLEGGQTVDDPAPISVAYAKACIDAGADAVFGTGPHRDRGIEIYKGKPIMYSLSTLFYENEVIRWQPNDLFEKNGLGLEATPADLYDKRTGMDTRTDPIGFKSAIVEAKYEGRELRQLVLTPIDAGFYTNRVQRGRPVIAQGTIADEILTRLQKVSEPLGTTIEISGSRGIIKVS